MAINSQTAFNIVDIVKHYLFSPKGKLIDRSHIDTTSTKLYCPNYLSSSIETLRYKLQSITTEFSEPGLINHSTIISSILAISFDKVFQNTSILRHINDILAHRREIFTSTHDLPGYTQRSIESWTNLSIYSLPDASYGTRTLLRPRIPKHTIAAYGERSTDLGIDLSQLFQITLIRILSTLSDLRPNNQLAMKLALDELQNYLHERSFFLKDSQEFTTQHADRWASNVDK